LNNFHGKNKKRLPQKNHSNRKTGIPNKTDGDSTMIKAVIFHITEVGGSATCSAMRISATCATRKIAADVRFDPQSADCGILLAH
jgi:hypothetical protein